MFQDQTCTVLNAINAINGVTSTRHLGTQLGLSTVQLDEIEKHDASEHNLRLVETWFTLRPSPTWERLVMALRASSVQENVIAHEIEERYILRRGSVTSDFSSPPSSPMSFSSVPSPSSSLTSSIFRSWSSGNRKGIIVCKYTCSSDCF